MQLKANKHARWVMEAETEGRGPGAGILMCLVHSRQKRSKEGSTKKLPACL